MNGMKDMNCWVDSRYKYYLRDSTAMSVLIELAINPEKSLEVRRYTSSTSCTHVHISTM